MGATGSIPVGELRSHVPCGVAKKKPKKQKKKSSVYSVGLGTRSKQLLENCSKTVSEN